MYNWDMAKKIVFLGFYSKDNMENIKMKKIPTKEDKEYIKNNLFKDKKGNIYRRLKNTINLASTETKDNYRMILINNKRFYVHKIIDLFPEEEIQTKIKIENEDKEYSIEEISKGYHNSNIVWCCSNREINVNIEPTKVIILKNIKHKCWHSLSYLKEVNKANQPNEFSKAIKLYDKRGNILVCVFSNERMTREYWNS